MKTLVLLGALCSAVLVCQAQTVVPSNIRATNTISDMVDMHRVGSGDLLVGIPLPAGKVVGDTYLDTHWRIGTILLYDKDKMIERMRLRYDIQSNEIDVKSASGVKVIPGSRVKSFVWVDSVDRQPDYFVNAKDFKMDGTPLSGFFQVLSDGTLPLLMKTNLEVKKADYNVSLDVGSKDDKILKKTDFFCLKDGAAIELPSSKKKLLPLFQDKAYMVEDYMKANALSASKQADLIRIFDYYNALIKTP